MRLYELDQRLTESQGDDQAIKNAGFSLPQSVVFPNMDSAYEFYRFAIALACHPELDDEKFDHSLRDIPMAIAYTPQEFEMIKAVAKRMGKKFDQISYTPSTEEPWIQKVSPVMKFQMSEHQVDIMNALLESYNR